MPFIVQAREKQQGVRKLKQKMATLPTSQPSQQPGQPAAEETAAIAVPSPQPQRASIPPKGSYLLVLCADSYSHNDNVRWLCR